MWLASHFKKHMYNVCVLGITHPITSQQIRAGSVWIFQTRFGFQSQVPGFGFFGFAFCTSPQWNCYKCTQRLKSPKDLKVQMWSFYTINFTHAWSAVTTNVYNRRMQTSRAVNVRPTAESGRLCSPINETTSHERREWDTLSRLLGLHWTYSSRNTIYGRLSARMAR